ncbi:MAG: hypothetical protein U0931_18525 [Vulcanimicrobiota bacterium]
MVWALLLLGLKFPYTWEEQGVRCTFINPEYTRDKHYVIAHLTLRPRVNVAAFQWHGLVSVINAQGQSVPQANDCKFDQSITTGMPALAKDKTIPLLMYWLAQPSDFPVQIYVGEQALGEPLGR